MEKTNAENIPAENIPAENNFQIVNEIRSDINTIFNQIDEKIKILNEIYNELVQTHHDKNYIIGLDSFHFQNKLIQLEYDNMKNIFNFIDNRVYCEYYKLHRMLFDFIKDIKDKSIVDKLFAIYKKYPIYKDLEPTKVYDFNVTIEINTTIHNALQDLKEYLHIKKREMNTKQKQTEMGINIHSIIHEQMYNNIILEERIHMFENYLNTFIKHHSKYFSRLTIKLKLMFGIVNEDFHLKKTTALDNKGSSTRIKRSISAFEYVSDTSSVSSSKSSMSDVEETNLRLLVGNTDSKKAIHSHLNTIIQHIVEERPTLRHYNPVTTSDV